MLEDTELPPKDVFMSKKHFDFIAHSVAGRRSDHRLFPGRRLWLLDDYGFRICPVCNNYRMATIQASYHRFQENTT